MAALNYYPVQYLGVSEADRLDRLNIPRHSMYVIYAYIGVVWGVNVGIYGIHGVSGIWNTVDSSVNSSALDLKTLKGAP